MVTIKKVVQVVLIMVLVVSALSVAGCGGGGGGADLFEQARLVARTEIWKDINSGKASGAGVAILDGGEIVYSEGFGAANREKSLPVTTETIFNMGSISKTFDAAAIMVLVDDGKLELDAPVTKYLPEFKMEDPRYKDITVGMLLDHTSGLPGTAYANNNGYEYNKSIYEDTLAYLAGSYLKAAPGETAPYCNDGFTLTEIIITRVSGSDYVDFLTDRVLTPLSLNKTGIGIAEREDSDYGAFYDPDTGHKLPGEIVSCLGAGGLSSTPEDLVLFADSFSGSGRTALSKGSIEEMTKAHPSTFAKTTKEETGFSPEPSYGLGLDLTDVDEYKKEGIKVIGKGGDTDDYHSMLLSVPGERLSVAVMEAGHGSSAVQIAFDVLDSVLLAKGLMQEKEATVSAPPQPQPIPGEYRAFSGFYATGTKLFQLTVDPDSNTGEFAAITNGVAGAPQPVTYRDGFFYTGSGMQFKLMSVDGRYFLVNPVWANKAFMVSAQRLPDVTEPVTLGSDITGAQWLRRNVKPFEETAETSDHLAVSTLPPDLPGFVDFKGIKLIKSPEYAGVALDLMQDLTDLTLYERNGSTWARISDMVYSPAEGAGSLDAGTMTVTIGEDGHNEWLKAGKDLILKVKKPDKGRVVVFLPDGSTSYDSVLDSGDGFVSQGSFIELAGYAGDDFKLTASPTRD